MKHFYYLWNRFLNLESNGKTRVSKAVVEHKNINGFVQNLLKFANIDIQTRLNLKAHSQIREQI